MATVRRFGIAIWLTFALCSRTAAAASPGPGSAQPADPAPAEQADKARRENADRHLLLARSETFLQLFRRALLPGANGTLVTTETALPLHQFLFVQARDLDLPWQKDGLDLDFSAWGRLWPGQSDVERPFDGDLQTASMRYRAGPAWVRLGRQHAAGGAARFARFDGVTIGAEQVSGVFAAGYAGYSVLPRWNERSGYHHLGSGEGEFSKYAVEPLQRAEHWLAGGHAGYRSQRFGGSASLHEQREAGGLERRNLGVDLTGRLHERASLGGSALFELDSRRLATLRLWADLVPIAKVDLGLEFLRAKPSLLLSRMSVLSVFTSDAYDEIGATLSFPAQSWLTFESCDDQGEVVRALGWLSCFLPSVWPS